MKINKKFEVETRAAQTAAVAVREPKPIAESQIAATIRELYRDVLVKNEEAFWARAKLGAVLIRWEEFLGKSKGGYESAGDGLKGWLEKNCPELGYTSALSYKASARMAATMIGNGAVAVAALLGEETVMQPDGEVIDIPADVIEKRDNLYKNVNSRRKLEQAYFEFMNENGGGKAKRKQTKGLAKSKLNGGEEEALSPEDQALVTWDKPMKLFMTTRGVFYASAKLLPVNAAENFIEELESLVKVLKKRVEEA